MILVGLKKYFFNQIVQSGGRSRQSVTDSFNSLKLADKAVRNLVYISLAVSVYNVITAKDKTKAFHDEVNITAVGILGRMLGGATAGLVCGIVSPICSSIGVFVGGAFAGLYNELSIRTVIASDTLCNNIYIRPVFKTNGKFSGNSRVYLNGYATECFVDGIVVDKIFKIYSYYLIFTSAGKDNVHSLIISLITQDASFVEEVLITNPRWLYDYDDETADHVSNFNFEQPNQVFFRFLDNGLWKVKVLEEPFYTWSSFFSLSNIDGAGCEAVVRNRWCYKTHLKFYKIK